MSASDKRKQAIKERRALVESGVRECLATHQGRLFLLDLLTDLGVFRTSYDEANPHNTDFNEGRRDGGLRLLRLIRQASADGYVKLIQDYGEIFANERRDDRPDPAGDKRDDDADG